MTPSSVAYTAVVRVGRDVHWDLVLVYPPPSPAVASRIAARLVGRHRTSLESAIAKAMTGPYGPDREWAAAGIWLRCDEGIRYDIKRELDRERCAASPYAARSRGGNRAGQGNAGRRRRAR